jgi:hypothetical protein
MKYILAILVAVVFIVCSCPAQENLNQSYEDREFEANLEASVIQIVASNLLNSASNTVSDPTVDAALDKMLAEGKNPIVSSLIVAKMDWLLNRPAKAIGILEDLVQKHGEESDGQGYIMPVGITANYWIGTIARQNGDAQRAKKAYEDVLACAARHPQDNAIGHEAEKQFCYQYISEIEAVMLNQKDAAIVTLMKIPQMPLGHRKESITEAIFIQLYELRGELNWDGDQAWIDHQIAILRGKSDEARVSLKGSGMKFQDIIGSLAGAPLRSGIPLRPWINGYGKENHTLLVQALRLAVKSNSQIDRSFALLALGSELQSDQPAEAEKYYTELMESDSFYAPAGGIYLAALQRSLGKDKAANKTEEHVKERFPGYAKYFDEMSKMIYIDKPTNSPPEPLHFNL